MRIVVTGGAGFVGSHIVDALIARGHAVRVLDDLRTGREENVNSGAELRRVDVTTQALAGHLADADAIVHAAAYADLRHNWVSVGQRSRLYTDNVDCTRALLEQMPGVPLVFLSTASVYGRQRLLRPVRETDASPETSESPYAASKLACEAMVAAYAHKRGYPWWALRLVNVVGARTRHGVIGDFVRMATENRRIHAADDGVQRKSWVHASDVAGAVVRLLDHGTAPQRGCYTVTSEERVSWWDVVEEMGFSRDAVTFESRAGGAVGDPVDLWCSGEKLAPYYRPRRPIRDGIREALEHLGWTRPEPPPRAA
jgi:UDP-glucose 4-epimerase